MAVTPDQQATLQLLLERGQSYADLARLLGQDEADVRARARAALTELGGADPDRNVGLTDYLLGQADPIGRADASRHLRDDPADHRLATELCESCGRCTRRPSCRGFLASPAGRGAARARRRRPMTAAATQGAPRRSGLSGAQTRTMVIAASAGVLLLAIVLAVAGAFGGGGDETTSAATSADASTAAASGDQEIQRVALKPVDGGDAKGDAVFGLATGDQPFVEVTIDGLDPAPSGQTYVVWLMVDDKQGYPLSPITVAGDGSFQNRFSIPCGRAAAGREGAVRRRLDRPGGHRAQGRARRDQGDQAGARGARRADPARRDPQSATQAGGGSGGG